MPAPTIEFLFADTTSFAPHTARYYRISQASTKKILRVKRNNPQPDLADVHLLTTEEGWEMLMTVPGKNQLEVDDLLAHAATLLNLD